MILMRFGAELLFVFTIIAIFLGVQTAQHENVHKEIYAEYGLNSTVKYGLVSVTTADPVGYKALPKEDKDEIRVLQAQAEIFGYHLFCVVVLLGGIFGILIVMGIENLLKGDD